jgi:four helix bundle protein
MRDYQRIRVWRRAHALVLSVFDATNIERRHAPPGLIGQIQRAVMAIPTNIAEGCGHASSREFARFLAIACGSAVELEYLLLLARDLGVLAQDRYDGIASETVSIRRMCFSLRRRVVSAETPQSGDA